MTHKPVFLDYAAATPVDTDVLAAMQPYFSDKFYNPSALYLAAKDIAKDISEARKTIGHWLGARPQEIIFTAGGTESGNLAIQGVMSQYPDANMVVSAIEHDAVLAITKRYKSKIAPVDSFGIINLPALEKSIDDKTVLVSIMYANNEIGSIQVLPKIANLLNKIRTERKKAGNDLPLLFHSDASQAANYLDLHVNKLGVDLLTLNGGKIYGPKQTGILYVKTGVRLQPLLLGGGQESNLRSGTENVPGIMGLAKALDLVQSSKDSEATRLADLQTQTIQQLQKKLPKIIINGSLKHRLPNNIHLTIPAVDNERLVMELDEAGFMTAVGSACSTSNDEPSHVLTAIGLDAASAQSSIRVTMGRQTTAQDMQRFTSTLIDIVQSL